MNGLPNRINEFFISVSIDMTKLLYTHPVFNTNDPLPEQFTINIDYTEQTLDNVIVNEGVDPDNSLSGS